MTGVSNYTLSWNFSGGVWQLKLSTDRSVQLIRNVSTEAYFQKIKDKNFSTELKRDLPENVIK